MLIIQFKICYLNVYLYVVAEGERQTCSFTNPNVLNTSKPTHLPGGKLMVQFYITSDRGRHLPLNRWFLLYPNKLYFFSLDLEVPFFVELVINIFVLFNLRSDGWRGRRFSSPFCNFLFSSYIHSNMQTTKFHFFWRGLFIFKLTAYHMPPSF